MQITLIVKPKDTVEDKHLKDVVTKAIYPYVVIVESVNIRRSTLDSKTYKEVRGGEVEGPPAKMCPYCMKVGPIHLNKNVQILDEDVGGYAPVPGLDIWACTGCHAEWVTL